MKKNNKDGKENARQQTKRISQQLNQTFPEY
jgi:hypothetical protein